MNNNNNALRLVKNEVVKPASNNVYVEALINSTPMSNLTTDNRLNSLMGNIIYANFIGGWKEKADADIQLMAANLMPDINSRFKNMTEMEVRAAFQAGAKGDYGPTYGVSVASCISWLNTYYLDQERQKAKKFIEKSLEPAPRPKMSRGEKRAFINTAYTKFCVDGFYKDYGNVIYDLIDQERLITFSNTQKREFLERGRKIVFDQLQNYKNLEQKRENEKKISDLMDNDKPAIGEAKRIALIEYFKILKEQHFTSVPFLNTCLKF